jgi:hypothetical protein
MLLAVVILTPGTAMAVPHPGQAPARSTQAISAQLEQVIAALEHAKLSCATRNTLVRRLRLVDDALVTGRRTGAAGLLAGWLASSGRMQSDRVLTGRLATRQIGRLRQRLAAVNGGIGAGWRAKPLAAKRWKALPRCADTAEMGNVSGSYEPFQRSDIKFVVQFIVNQIPGAGRFLGPLVMILWPTTDPTANVASMISDAVSSNVRDQLRNKLNGLNSVLNAFLADEQTMATACKQQGTECTSATDVVAHEFIQIRDQFITDEPAFQWNSEADYRVELLPMYAQWETLFLTFLREGYLAAPSWGWTPTQVSDYVDRYIDQQFNSPDHGTGYTDAVYAKGLPPQSTQATGWAERNAYEREMTLGVKVFQDMWPYLDPQAYPNGNPDFVDTRIVFSDPIGEPHGPIVTPANVTHPISRLTWWSQDAECGANGCGFEQAIKVDNAPAEGAITGNPETNGTIHTIDTTPTGWGAVVVAKAATDQRGIFYPSWVVAGLQFQRASGTFSVSDTGWTTYGGRPRYSYAFDDMVLATAQEISAIKTAFGRPATDSIIFGFRYADSLG